MHSHSAHTPPVYVGNARPPNCFSTCDFLCQRSLTFLHNFGNKPFFTRFVSCTVCFLLNEFPHPIIPLAVGIINKTKKAKQLLCKGGNSTVKPHVMLFLLEQLFSLHCTPRRPSNPSHTQPACAGL